MGIVFRKWVVLIITLQVAVILLTSCASTYKPINLNASTALVWPAQPADPRIAYVASFRHPDNFGISKGFFTRLGELFTGENDNRLIRPMAITVSMHDEIFVADPGAKGVHRYSLKKNRYTFIQQKDNKVLPSPVGMVADVNGDLYIIDSELARLFRVNRNKTTANEVSLAVPLVQPTAIALDQEEGLLYITDTAEHHVKVFSIEGSLMSIIGRRGKENGEFNFPTMLWRDKAGQLFVTDSLNFRIQTFDREGKFLRFFGKPGDATGNMSRPKGVATDTHGHIYVVDGLFHNVQLFDQDGTFLLHVGAQGQGQGEFWLPSGIFIADNVIYIADSHNQRVQVFRYIGGQP